MRTSSVFLVLALVGAYFVAEPTSPKPQPPQGDTSEAHTQAVREAVDIGLSHARRGDHAAAVGLLERAAQAGNFVATSTLAQIYADPNSPESAPAKAFDLYQRIVEQHARVDADTEDRPLASRVARALTGLAGYYQTGLPEIGMPPDTQHAMYLLQLAATVYDDEDAQFELLKMLSQLPANEINPALVRHWMASLTRRGHAGGQAMLAELFWLGDGDGVVRDPVMALALSAVALENAPRRDRVWIEDIYQKIYCGASGEVRTASRAVVADWREHLGRRPIPRAGSQLPVLDIVTERTCGGDDRVMPLHTPADSGPVRVPPSPAGARVAGGLSASASEVPPLGHGAASAPVGALAAGAASVSKPPLDASAVVNVGVGMIRP